MTRQETVLWQIAQERKRQDEKWGPQRSLPDLKWLAILAEEFGEVAKDILERKDTVRVELIQVAAVAVAWLEAIEGRAS